MSTTISSSVSRSGTPLGTRPPSTITTTSTTAATSSSDPTSNPHSDNSSNNYFSYPVTRVVSGLYRRLTDPPQKSNNNNTSNANNMNSSRSSSTSLYIPKRTASPFQPPPLTPLTLNSSTATGSYILSRALAEEIRLLVPPRLQLVDTWRLAYSLERDGSSLSTLYDHCRKTSERHPRAGYVLVVRDTSDGGAVFGAYLTDAPHPAPHFYGTGECFLWRASVLGLASQQGVWNHTHHHHHHHHHNHTKHNDNHEDDEQESNGHDFHTMTDEELQRAGFPPPPSADTTHAVRSTTVRASTPTLRSDKKSNNLLSLPTESSANNSGTSTPERIRFKAFPYSGMNDYMIFCETGFLSIGGGDGHYGLWIDDSVEKGVSDSCPTFGNEPLSDEGSKFDILGLEIWSIST
ncbi:hypothetical protein EYB25_009091 [Talaromyces marneffei]|uniref:uncharacterized protein n=1 Tax=Talaromyces marneffei TaxID=37727 RepID=UPI0012A7F290|nr:uncharacterized protein EYB26_009767 [Talaromyces marneffei]KAE8548710.1 hypothetical protein EYB25_009091 [Talaromyces marneffei]QGA22053.1 hypothetical protein EYB26_009767 [Talaromyces marneffei]